MNRKNFWLEKIDIITTSAYAGYTANVWLKLFAGTFWTMAIPEVAIGVLKMLFASTLLVVFWHKLSQWRD